MFGTEANSWSDEFFLSFQRESFDEIERSMKTENDVIAVIFPSTIWSEWWSCFLDARGDDNHTKWKMKWLKNFLDKFKSKIKQNSFKHEQTEKVKVKQLSGPVFFIQMSHPHLRFHESTYNAQINRDQFPWFTAGTSFLI